MNANDLLNAAGCTMKVVCNRNWDDFLDTEEDGIRFCGECKKAVFYTQTKEEMMIAAKRGLCVYIEPKSRAQEFDAELTKSRRLTGSLVWVDDIE